MNIQQQELIDILQSLNKIPKKHQTNTNMSSELYKMFVHIILQLSEDKINGFISADTEDKILTLRNQFNKYNKKKY